MVRSEEPNKIADELIREHGLKEAMDVVMKRVAQTYGEGDGYQLSVLREVKYILAVRAREGRLEGEVA